MPPHVPISTPKPPPVQNYSSEPSKVSLAFGIVNVIKKGKSDLIFQPPGNYLTDPGNSEGLYAEKAISGYIPWDNLRNNKDQHQVRL